MNPAIDSKLYCYAQNKLNQEQEIIITHKKGPLLIIAGPGSGKTHSLTLLAMNLLLHRDARPSEIILCTYTKKSALDIQDRLGLIAKKVQYLEDLSQMRVDTIHGICKRLISEHLQDTPLANSYETLDQLPQRLFIFEHLEELCTAEALALFAKRAGWETRWDIAKQLQSCFDKITEELIFDRLKDAITTKKASAFVYHLTCAYYIYRKTLRLTHRIDFALLEKTAYDLLYHSPKAKQIIHGIRYVLVDEYQDTNYIQEQILFKLASATGNLCAVGDEDQALYRFRGATVRNILEFTETCSQWENFSPYQTTKLMKNYRSHYKIIEFCNQWIASTSWSNSGGKEFRTEKVIEPYRDKYFLFDKHHQTHTAVCKIIEESIDREAERFAALVWTLKEQKIIQDYSEVALLLRSVKPRFSSAFVEALNNRNIPVYCPRARAYFEQQEVRLMIGCFACILGYQKEYTFDSSSNDDIGTYLNSCLDELAKQFSSYPALDRHLSSFEQEMAFAITDGKEPIKPGDYFYQLLATELFLTFTSTTEQMANMVQFSHMLDMFSTCYHMSSFTTLEQLQQTFFFTFLRLLYIDGMNEQEEVQQPTLPGHVQIMTIHQAKGLEFPVVVVGRLDEHPSHYKDEDKELQPFYLRKQPFEPIDSITRFDLTRLYYVAFSRAKHILVLSAGKRPNKYLAPLINTLPRWEAMGSQFSPMPTALQEREREQHEKQKQLKRRFSFTKDIRTYETCPRRYAYFCEHKFSPANTEDYFIGQLVHQTIENLHRKVRDGQFAALNSDTLLQIFNKVATCLEQRSRYAPHDVEKQRAFTQVMNYFLLNQEEICGVEEAEVPISLEKEQYIVTGTIDVLTRVKGRLYLLDFKTGRKHIYSTQHIRLLQRQLCTYAYILRQRRLEPPERLFLYWTEEEHKKDAWMEVFYHPEEAEEDARHFDEIVSKIMRKQFAVENPPGGHTCKSCDLRNLCAKEGLIPHLH